VVDVVTSQAAVSSDAKKGLGFVPDFQPLTAWDDAERHRRGQRVQDPTVRASRS
jgi:acetolactate synthase-1/2/3 large subunit